MCSATSLTAQPQHSADHSSTRARTVLSQVFGYDQFRGQQQRIVDTVLQGGHALVLMPTGGGKSLCYQLPALLLDGLTVVVSPLIALMKDQVDSLRELGVAAAFLNSTLSLAEQRHVETALRQQQLKLLYVAPERLLNEQFLHVLSSLNVSLFAIDEAHCVSQWGHDFRPEYQKLGVLAERFGRVPRIALTATADQRTRSDILAVLDLAHAPVFLSSFDRPNIHYTVVEKHNGRKQLLDFIRTQAEGSAGIVYCLSRKRVEETAAFLHAQGLPARAYHAGLPQADRAAAQDAFLLQEGQIICATVAFGMGINKPNVRFVAHLDLPKSLEGYYQETGRAGRDGLPSQAWMAYGMADLVNVRRMVQQSDAPPEIRRIESSKLDALMAYCQTATCRRQHLLAYFGETRPDPCGHCDVCNHPPRTWDGTIAAQKALSAVIRTGNRFGVAHLIDLLLGQPTDKINQLGHHQLPTFGVGNDLSAAAWRNVYQQLVALGYLVPDDDRFGGLIATPAARDVLKGQTVLHLRSQTEPVKTSRKKTQPIIAHSTLSPEAQRRFAAMRQLRLTLAQAQNVPPYVIFSDATLRDMAINDPTNPVQFRAISGVGEQKLQRYGDDFLGILAQCRVTTQPHPPSLV